MLYQQPKFTLPAANSETTQFNWDLAFLSKEEFVRKYNAEPAAVAAGASNTNNDEKRVGASGQSALADGSDSLLPAAVSTSGESA